MSKTQILGAYRLLLKTSMKTFRNDQLMLNESAKRIREAFDSYRLESDPAKVGQLLQDAQDAAEFLRCNIVQAELNERGSYEIKITDDTINERGNYVISTPSMDMLKEKPSKAE
eukprot:TRINITY_DN1434_c0_g1_i3.p2 TRINITY_DN1434_c0_g1~~TRINITY_DN1434_c0_g1_i3.p2  ORF type:complete len:131 (-),score=10.69 TRINITY_DN1434_c0_g1_i3:271-612(-)